MDRKVVAAVKLRVQGQSWRACGEAVGMDPSNLRKAAKARGYRELPEERRPYFAALFARVADEAARQLQERLEAGERMSPKELGIIAGISVDKVASAEGWSRQTTEQPGAWIAAIAERLRPGESVDARLEVNRSRAVIDAEVLPEGGGNVGAPQREEGMAHAEREEERAVLGASARAPNRRRHPNKDPRGAGRSLSPAHEHGLASKPRLGR